MATAATCVRCARHLPRAEKPRTRVLCELGEAVALGDLSRVFAAAGESAEKMALPAFKQYREADGRFYFKLVDGDRVLLQSAGFDSPKDAGQCIAALKREGRVDRNDTSLCL